MRTFFTADMHFGHSNIIKHCNRPFDSAEEMDATMIENWNDQVSNKDTVFILGDVAFSNIERVAEIFKQLNGKLKLIPGNHDAALMKKKEFHALFSEVLPPIYETKIEDKHVVMCHYPMMSWNRAYHGAYHLHGHTHGMIPFDNKFRRFDVGVDVNGFGPISWEAVVRVMNTVQNRGI